MYADHVSYYATAVLSTKILSDNHRWCQFSCSRQNSSRASDAAKLQMHCTCLCSLVSNSFMDAAGPSGREVQWRRAPPVSSVYSRSTGLEAVTRIRGLLQAGQGFRSREACRPGNARLAASSRARTDTRPLPYAPPRRHTGDTGCGHAARTRTPGAGQAPARS